MVKLLYKKERMASEATAAAAATAERSTQRARRYVITSDGSISHRSSAARGRDKDSGLERESCITDAMVCTVHIEYIESRT
jgi:hypothetical protein